MPSVILTILKVIGIILLVLLLLVLTVLLLVLFAFRENIKAGNITDGGHQYQDYRYDGHHLFSYACCVAVFQHF